MLNSNACDPNYYISNKKRRAPKHRFTSSRVNSQTIRDYFSGLPPKSKMQPTSSSYKMSNYWSIFAVSSITWCRSLIIPSITRKTIINILAMPEANRPHNGNLPAKSGTRIYKYWSITCQSWNATLSPWCRVSMVTTSSVLGHTTFRTRRHCWRTSSNSSIICI